MKVLTIIIFLTYMWGLGFTITSLIKAKFESSFEKCFMSFGIGFGIFPILAVIINALRIPLDWKIFLGISLVYPTIYLVNKIRKKQLIFPTKINLKQIKVKKSSLFALIVLVIFSFSFFTYLTGAFAYPYLEDSDPWAHANGAKYISIEKSGFQPEGVLNSKGKNYIFSYLAPYPSSYDILMGVLHQTNDSINWTLKFFNALIISLGIIFFYFAILRFTKRQEMAIFAAFVLAAIPGYLSHFIWAHVLIPTLFFIALYALEKGDEDKKWFILSAIIIASIAVSQPTQPIKIFVLLLIYGVIKLALTRKNYLATTSAIVGGYLLSLIWWVDMMIQYGGIKGMASTLGFGKKAASSAGLSGGPLSFIKSVFNPTSGSATRSYSFSDFFVAEHNNMINQPIGWGIVVTIILIIAIIYLLVRYKKLWDKKNYWAPITLGWFIFTFLGVNSMTFNLPVGLFAFRFWMLLAIPTAILAAYGYIVCKNTLKKFGIPTILIILIIVSGVFFTSAIQKHSANTAVWPTYGYFMGNPQVAIQYYEFFDTIPKNSAVFTYSDRNHLMSGMDVLSCNWCQEVFDLTNNGCILDLEISELQEFLKRYNYEYLIAGIGDLQYLPNDCGGEEVTQEKFQTRISELMESPNFEPIYQKEQLYIVFKLR